MLQSETQSPHKTKTTNSEPKQSLIRADLKSGLACFLNLPSDEYYRSWQRSTSPQPGDCPLNVHHTNHLTLCLNTTWIPYWLKSLYILMCVKSVSLSCQSLKETFYDIVKAYQLNSLPYILN